MSKIQPGDRVQVTSVFESGYAIYVGKRGIARETFVNPVCGEKVIIDFPGTKLWPYETVVASVLVL